VERYFGWLLVAARLLVAVVFLLNGFGIIDQTIPAREMLERGVPAGIVPLAMFAGRTLEIVAGFGLAFGGLGLDAAFFEPLQHQLSDPTYRGIFGSIKSFWTVLDHQSNAYLKMNQHLSGAVPAVRSPPPLPTFFHINTLSDGSCSNRNICSN
jgi:hypothetical protein